MFRSLVHVPARQLASVRTRVAVAALTVFALVLAVAPMAFATETEAQTKVKTVAESVASEGIAIFLIIVGAIGTLFALVIAVMLGFRKIRALVK